MKKVGTQHQLLEKNYIEITEEELDDILLGKESENIEQEGKEVGQMFRF